MVDARWGAGSEEALPSCKGPCCTRENFWKHRCKSVQFGAFWVKMHILNGLWPILTWLVNSATEKCTNQCLIYILEDHFDDIRTIRWSKVARIIDTFPCYFSVLLLKVSRNLPSPLHRFCGPWWYCFPFLFNQHTALLKWVQARPGFRGECLGIPAASFYGLWYALYTAQLCWNTGGKLYVKHDVNLL